ncbi:endo-beta-N-acetylglucosaminidase [Streptomyces sp. ITFR-16]|uniref:endo-beta-N-acetylglucosaminidase n=1 Tax=Streptomyces sp. ITFR-16 TaxID=3075198 RepID=UPI00288B3F96|nr:endo-beta-N-acetylglucosaminidase [Streptomyces sp. ITFR-16]WNI23835.1 endo-beta-N-acetylglucosaminidase [Streptomyces sp. ITFR-16]
MNEPRHRPAAPTRRTVVLAGAGTAAALLAPVSAATAQAAPAAPSAPAGLQPYASYWFPDSLPSGTPGDGITWRSLKSWRPEDDPDLAFNTASVPLAGRFTPVPVNTTARTGQARISSLVAFGNTAGNPSQGSATADYYALNHWAYIDELVFWGGSAGEGLILAPNAPVVDAAHRNGVPVLGTVFLPPVHHGGDLRWTRDLVQRDAAGRFPLAAKLVEAAVAHGFDGWFLNAETEGGDAALGAEMLAFVTDLRRRGKAAGLRVTWYDAMTVRGQVGWQGALNAENTALFEEADSMFVDFRWTPETLAASGNSAEAVGRSRYDLWAGVDVESTGWNRAVDWDAIIPADRPHTVSYGFYRPEWTRGHLPEDRTPAQFHAADQRFWTGQSLDPARPDRNDGWRAPATAVADRSTVDRLPFATTFNTGHGLRWYEEGRVTSDTEWNHLGLQDRLPGRRWVVRTEGRVPSVAFDFADAWRGGSSLLVDGELDAPATVELYGTRLPLSRRTVVELTHRTDPGSGPVTVELAVALREPDRPGDPVAYTYLPAGELRSGGTGWTTSVVRPRALSGTVRALGVRLTAAGPVRWRLGALAVRDGAETPAAPSGLRVTGAATGPDGTGLRFSWRRAAGRPRHYELHRILPDGTRRFLGGTASTAFHVPGLRGEPGEKAARFQVRAVGELYTTSGAASTAHRW